MAITHVVSWAVLDSPGTLEFLRLVSIICLSGLLEVLPMNIVHAVSRAVLDCREIDQLS